MRGVLKSFGIIALSIYLTGQLVPTLKIFNINTFIILTGLIFLANFIINPLTKILFFLPHNILVFNLATIFSNFLVIFLLAKSLPELQVEGFSYLGGSGFGINIQAFNLTATQTTILVAALISALTSFFNWLTD